MTVRAQGRNLTMPTQNSPETLSLYGHLDELRRRIILSLLFLAAGTCVGFFFCRELITLLELPSRGIVPKFILLKPTEIVGIYVKTALFAGLTISAPAIFYQFWRFVVPALTDDMRFSFPSWLAAAAGLFVTGCSFSFFVLIPAAIRFLYALSVDVAEPAFSLGGYVSFTLSLLALTGIVFEMPLAAALLTKIRLLSPGMMRGHRREAIFGLCVAAAVLTPTTDIFNMLLFVAPMVALYEVSILVSAAVARSRSDRTEGIYAEVP